MKKYHNFSKQLKSTNTQAYQNHEFQNDYGTIMSDLTKPYTYRTQIYQFDIPTECTQNTTQMLQTNQYDIRLPNPDLTDIESELRNITRPLSKLPATRYQGSEKHVSWLKNFKRNEKECERKIINYDIKQKLRNNITLNLKDKI